MKNKKLLTVITVFLFTTVSSIGFANALTGSIQTTDGSCVNHINKFNTKSDVYLQDGTQTLEDGSYYVQVTNPNGSIVLGTSIGSLNETPVVVSGSIWGGCYQLESILIKGSNGAPGYDDTTNGGGVYKVWVSKDPSFPSNESKTDNFKVKADVPCVDLCPPPPHDALITICKDSIPNDIQDFGFTGSLGTFTLDDDGADANPLDSCYGNTVTPGSVVITEDLVTNWTLEKIECTGVDSYTADLDNRQVTFTTEADQSISCTFTNQGKATINIKKVSLDGNGIFDFEISNASTIPVSINTASGPNQVSTIVNAGDSYSVVEKSPLPEWFNYVGVECKDQGLNPIGNPITQGKEGILVNPGDEITCTFTNQGLGKIAVYKFYDLNTNGVKDGAEPFLTGWKIAVDGVPHLTFWGYFYVPGSHTVTEYNALQTNWIHTTTTSVPVNLPFATQVDVKFGNVCTGKGGGLSKGFWGNQNGFAKMNDGGTVGPELALLTSYKLVDGIGADFDPATYAAYKLWSQNANAVNMSYMLSAQLAAMVLNVESNSVSGGSLIYAPELVPFAIPGLTPTGFISITDLMAAANSTLIADQYTPSGDPNRPLQGALKNVLDRGDNNIGFVQPNPCTFTFPVE